MHRPPAGLHDGAGVPSMAAMVVALSVALSLAALAVSTPVHGQRDTVGRDDALVRHDYALHCSGCHRMDGAGVQDAVPSFDAVEALMSAPEGREYLVRVPGVAHAPVADERLAALLNYVAFGLAGADGVEPYTTAEVARHRADPLIDPLAARDRLDRMGISAPR